MAGTCLPPPAPASVSVAAVAPRENGPHDRRPAHRPIGQVPPPRGGPPGRRGRASRDRAVRRARAGTRARPHLPADAARTVERPGRRPRRRGGHRHTSAVQPVRRPACGAHRRRRDDGAVRPAAARQASRARAGPREHRPGSPHRSAAEQEDRADGRDAHRRRHGGGARQRARQSQAGVAESRLARRGPRGLRRRRGAPHRPRSARVDAAALPGAGRAGVRRRRFRGDRPALRRRQDARRCGRDGACQGDHPDPRDEHRRRPAVARRTPGPDVAHRGRDRGVLRSAQGGPAGDDRHLPGRHVSA